MLIKKYENPKLNGFVVLYVVFAITCVVVDYFKLVEYYLIKQNNIFHLEISTARQIYLSLASLAAIGLFMMLVITLRKNYRRLMEFIYFPQIDKTDWLVILFIFAITFLRLPLPDRSFDVLNYHLFLQGFGFENNLIHNFFPGNIQTFTFPLGDRLFFIFRIILGYRAGVLLNTLVLILLFFQIKELVVLDKSLEIAASHKRLLLSFFALFALSTEYILANIGTYMVDLLMLPFLLELVKMAVGRKTTPEFVIIYSGLMIGLSLSFKFPSVIFCGLLFVIILFRYFRELSFRVVIISSFVLVFPLACYILYNVTQTGSPLFPFFNNYFKSPFYSTLSFKVNVGPTSIYETLVWPIYILFNPLRTVELGYYSGRMGLGLLIAVAYMSFGLAEKKLEHIFLGLFSLVLIYLWAFTSGAIRYGLFIEIILGLLIVKFVYILYKLDIRLLNFKAKATHILNIYYSDRRKYYQVRSKLIAFVYGLDLKSGFIKSLSTLIIVSAFSQTAYAYYLTITNKTDWASRPSIQNGWDTYIDNINMIGRDHAPLKYKTDDNLIKIIDDIDVWIVNPGENISGYEKLLKGNVPILTLQWSKAPQGTQAAIDLFENIKQAENLRLKNMYMLSLQTPEASAAELDKYGFKITAVYEIQPTFTYYPILLVKVVLK